MVVGQPISLEMILAAARTAEETPQLHPDDVETSEKIKDTITHLENAISDSTKNKTLKDLI